MRINRDRARQLLNDFDLQTLFTQELGWEHHSQTLPIQINETEYTLNACARKRGMVAFYYVTPSAAEIPDHAMRRKIERQAAKSVHEHLIIYADRSNTTQIWQWVRREPGNPEQCRELSYHPNRQAGEALIQSLDGIKFSFEEEEGLTLVDVTSRVRATFNVEKVTKRFYDHFKKEHDAFLEFLDGIPDEGMQRWYVSVILNRLMFIYFIQAKGFLDGDLDYLSTKLTQSRLTGVDRYYKAVLCPLFFEGFAKPESERSDETNDLLGNVPYLNGGIFQKHQIEEHHGERILIPDAAFEQLFDFFKRYQWRLDDRPLRNDNEINPDVLGYIFEKYINQKEKGAYYTKEDITEYISKNTIIPFLLDTARKNCKIAFEPPTDANSATVWQLLRKQPDRYIYDAVKHGTEHELPPDIAAGIDDVPARTGWNAPAPSNYALPTEIWREVVARRERYKEIRAKLSNGDIHEVDDLITYNLNIRQFVQDIIENCEGPDLLRAFWKAIKAVTILDPTCGSGAFLFAALNILEPLYEACLDRMASFVDELNVAAEKPHPNKYGDFRADLDRIKEHPNPTYFILKSIIINNLYGVDIMEEALEICKLRLFLKMVAQIEDVNEIEPLPDIDFNIKAGNTLVGYATYDDVNRAITENRIDFENTMSRIEAKADDIEHLFALFRQQQIESPENVTPADKQELQTKLNELSGELSRYLAGEYDVASNNDGDYQKWLTSHKPFHWFIEFYGILKERKSDEIKKGGFDVIIGNPPYVEYNEVKKQYTVSKYTTKKCGNLYAMSIERSMVLAKGPIGMIVQLPLVCTDRMIPAQSLFKNPNRKSWFASFDDRPGKLFEDLQHIRATIFLSKLDKGQNIATLYATQYKRWFTEARSTLFEDLAYGDITTYCFEGVFPKMADLMGQRIASKLKNTKRLAVNYKTGKFACRFHNSPQYWIRATDFVPYFWNERDGQKQSVQVKDLLFPDKTHALALCAVLNSSLFYWWFIISSDCRHLNIREIINFYFPSPQKLDKTRMTKLSDIVHELMHHYQSHANRKETKYKTTGKVVYDEFYPRRSKLIIDKIDRVLGEYYGFSDKELDYIINYDIKYRMGLGSGD